MTELSCCLSVFNTVSTVINPATGSVIGNVPDMTGDDVNHAVDAAYKAFQTWKLTTAKVKLHTGCFKKVAA